MEWISVKDQLPEMDGKPYLVSFYGYADKANNGIDVSHATGSLNWYGHIQGRGFGITHWMPLPAPPRENA